MDSNLTIPRPYQAAPPDGPARAYADLKRRILTLDLQPGQKLPAQDIADRLGLSRTPVREALQRLAQDGLIEKSGGWGFVVRRIGRQDLADLFEARRLLEPEAARLTLRRGGIGGIARLTSLLDAAEAVFDSADPQPYLDRSRAFHVGIAEATGNRLLLNMLLLINDRIQRVGAALIRRYPDRPAEVLAENRAILAGLSTGDEAALLAAVARHIDRPAALIAADQAWFDTMVGGG
jgi:DNA-binding GntR family transcriptional regulator